MSSFFKITSLALAASAFVVSGCDTYSDIDPTLVTLDVDLVGDQEVPPVTTANSATGELKITGENGAYTLVATVTTSGFTATGVHIHREFAGANGPVEFALSQDSSNAALWTTEVTADQTIRDLIDGAGFYFNAHSTENAGGEVRGQIVPDGISVKHFPLEGSQEVPPVTTTATGFAAATYDQSTGEIIVNAESDTANSTAAHVHQGATGSNGGVAFALTRDSGNTNRWNATATLNETQAAAYVAGNLYVNIH